MATQCPTRAQFESELTRLVEDMLARSGTGEAFDARCWVRTWLKHPLPALGFTPPANIAGTALGRQRIRQILACIESGAYL